MLHDRGVLLILLVGITLFVVYILGALIFDLG